jgi:hypothetical protein
MVPGDEIRNKRENVLVTVGRLSKGAGGVIIELDIDDIQFTYQLGVLSDGGGNNVVYSISSMVDGAWVHLDDILIRLQRLPGETRDSDDSDDSDDAGSSHSSAGEGDSVSSESVESAHQDEVSIGRELAGRGISPYIYLDLRLDYERAGATTKVLGTAMERFAHSLRDVASCPTLMRWFFVECDGESALVDLYVRAARYVRCIDTKPSNVVVNLPDANKPRRTVALIDTDERFCGCPDQTKTVTGRFRVDDLGRYLRGLKRPFKDKRMRLDKSPVLVATVSLLMHVTVSAVYDDKEFGFPYPRITQALLDNWDVVEYLADADSRRVTGSEHRMAESTRVIYNIDHYCDPSKGGRPICEWSGLRAFLEERASTFMTRALVACSDGGCYPELYEFVAQMNFKGGENVTPESLQTLVRTRMEGLPVRIRCMLDECPYHPDREESAVVRYAPRGPRERRSIHVNEIPDPVYDPLLRSIKESNKGPGKGPNKEQYANSDLEAAALVYHALVEDHGETSAIEVAALVHSRGVKRAGSGKLAKWLKRSGVMKHLADIAARAMARASQGPMAHFA